MVGEVVESNLLPWQCMAMVWCGGRAASRGEDGSFCFDCDREDEGCGLWIVAVACSSLVRHNIVDKVLI